jgi:hypothetical protein
LLFKEWLLPEVVEANDDVMMTKKTIVETTLLFPPKLLHGDKDDKSSIMEATISLRYFQELVVHPVMLSMNTEQGAHRIAIVCDDNQFLWNGWVQLLLLYPSVQSIYIIGKESQKQGCHETCWNDILSMRSDFSSSASSRINGFLSTLSCHPFNQMLSLCWMIVPAGKSILMITTKNIKKTKIMRQNTWKYSYIFGGSISHPNRDRWLLV